MNSSDCQFNEEVFRAISSPGNITDDMQEHISLCRLCQETILIATAMRRVKTLQSGEVPTLVSPKYIWWQNQLQAKQTEAKNKARAFNFISVVQFSLAALLLAGALILLAMVNQTKDLEIKMQSFFAAFNSSSIPVLFPAVIVIAIAVLISLFALRELSRD